MYAVLDEAEACDAHKAPLLQVAAEHPFHRASETADLSFPKSRDLIHFPAAATWATEVTARNWQALRL